VCTLGPSKATISDKFPISIIKELSNKLHSARYFSKLDLKSRYYQVRIMEEDIHKTTIQTREDYYEYLVMPFGLMNEVFRDLLRKEV